MKWYDAQRSSDEMPHRYLREKFYYHNFDFLHNVSLIFSNWFYLHSHEVNCQHSLFIFPSSYKSLYSCMILFDESHIYILISYLCSPTKWDQFVLWYKHNCKIINGHLLFYGLTVCVGCDVTTHLNCPSFLDLIYSYIFSVFFIFPRLINLFLYVLLLGSVHIFYLVNCHKENRNQCEHLIDLLRGKEKKVQKIFCCFNIVGLEI